MENSENKTLNKHPKSFNYVNSENKFTKTKSAILQ